MGNKTNLKGILAVAAILLSLVSVIAAGNVIYVDADASLGGDGTSWATAYKYLQDALAVAQDGNDIWVAEGTYYPDKDEGGSVDPNDRTETFQLINGVAVYGGLVGDETMLDERDWQINETILSGDINTPGDISDNSYHVVTSSGTDATAVLNGFTITDGNANGGSFPNNCGGGLHNAGSSPTVTNCIFVASSAVSSGGGMNNTGSSPTVTNCIFSGNYSGNSGGGMHNHNNSSPTLVNCTFSGNSSGSSGGGMFNHGSNPMVTNCTFRTNTAGSGGGMCNGDGSSPTLTNCAFSGNSVSAGSSGWGGGINNYNNSNPTVKNCTFSENSASGFAGGIYNYNSSPTLTNCIFWGNTAPSGSQIYNGLWGSVTVSYSDVQGGWPGTENIDEDPVFIDPNGLDGIPGTADDEEGYVHLRGYSPCINAGDPAGDYSGQIDIDGQERIAYGRVDMGADEVYPITGDFEPDGDVDFADFARFANNWLLSPE